MAEKRNIWVSAAGIAAGVLGWAAVSYGWDHFTGRDKQVPTEAQIEQALAGDELFDLLKREFPEDHAAVLTQLKQFAATGVRDRKQVMTEGARATQAIRMKYASFARRAPRARLEQVLMAHVRVIEKVERERGKAVCDAYNNDGPKVLFPDVAFVEPEMKAASLIVFQAIAEGRAESFDPDPPGTEDAASIQALLEEQAKAGEDLSRMSCAATVQLLRAIAALPGEAGDRVRAQFVQELVSTPAV